MNLLLSSASSSKPTEAGPAVRLTYALQAPPTHNHQLDRGDIIASVQSTTSPVRAVKRGRRLPLYQNTEINRLYTDNSRNWQAQMHMLTAKCTDLEMLSCSI